MFEPGKSGNPKGRPPGIVDKRVAPARATIAAFVDNNTERLNRLLDKIEAENPKAAFDAIMSVVEYHIPKLARSEIENKMSIAFEPLVIERAQPQELIDVTPVEVVTSALAIEPEKKGEPC